MDLQMGSRHLIGYVPSSLAGDGNYASLTSVDSIRYPATTPILDNLTLIRGEDLPVRSLQPQVPNYTHRY